MNRLGFLLAAVAACITALLCVVTGLMDRSKGIPLLLSHYYAKWFLPLCGIRIETDGIERIDTGRNYILCSNHQGLFDIFSIMGAIRLPLRFVSKPSYFKIPFIGIGMKGAGHILITRQDKGRDRATLDQLVLLAKSGANIVMFPEGTRSRDGTVGPFKYGAFYTAFHSGRPILPITIKGSFQRMRKGHLLPVPGTIEIFIHEPISPRGKSIDSLMEKTREVILSKF